MPGRYLRKHLGQDFFNFLRNVYYYYYVNVYSFLIERERENASRGRTEREGDTESEAAPGSELSAHSLTRGLNPQTVRS